MEKVCCSKCSDRAVGVHKLQGGAEPLKRIKKKSGVETSLVFHAEYKKIGIYRYAIQSAQYGGMQDSTIYASSTLFPLHVA